MTPVNLVTGLLGSGKTSTIRHLLAHKPAHEHWAVLVNEFGSIGIDGALLTDDGIEVRQVAGGCICCVSSPLFRVGLTRLLREAKPDRVLIEPSGLAHPAAVVDMLRDAYFARAVRLDAVVCIVDPRQLGDAQAMPLLHDQLQLADIVVANKADLAAPADLARLATLLAGLYPPRAITAAVEHGRLDPVWLASPSTVEAESAPTPPSHLLIRQPRSPASEILDGLQRRAGTGHVAYGASWPPDRLFDGKRLHGWLALQQANPSLRRAKGVVRIGNTWWQFNLSGPEREWQTSAWRRDSRIELIFDEAGAPACELLERELAELLLPA